MLGKSGVAVPARDDADEDEEEEAVEEGRVGRTEFVPRLMVAMG